MYIEHDFYVGLRDINKNKELTNTSMLSFLENVACMHSEKAGYGVTTINETKKTWIILSWKIKVLNRPKFNDELKCQTWSKLIDKFYAYRDFRIYNQTGELVAIAASKWVLMDIEKKKLVKIPQDIISKYEPEEEDSVFENELVKLAEPVNYSKKSYFKIRKNMIDINSHLHNIYYLDLAKEVLPDKIVLSKELNEFEIMYKKEIKLNENVVVLYFKEKNYHYVTIKSEDEKNINAIIKMKE